jgi:hypothetical protein
VRQLASQYFQYGRWKRVMVSRNPSSLRWRQLVPPLFVMALVVSLVLLGFGSISGLVVPVAYAGAVLTATVVEVVRLRDWAAIGLVCALPTMHLTWGAGFILGRSDAESANVGSVDS